MSHLLSRAHTCGLNEVVKSFHSVVMVVSFEKCRNFRRGFSGCELFAGISLILSPPLSMNGRLVLESREAVDLHETEIALVSIDRICRRLAAFPASRWPIHHER